MAEYLPIIGITMGDPAGIGPEIIAKVLFMPNTHEKCRPVVLADANIMRSVVSNLHIPLEINEILSLSEAQYQNGVMNVLIKDIPTGNIRLGRVSSMAGNMAFQSVLQAIDLARKSELDAVVTAPVHKASLNMAGHKFSGHTEIFAHFTNTQKYAMVLANGNFRVIHVSTHVALREACELVKQERILEVITLMDQFCIQLGIEKPLLGVAGLNPHAGDNGLFGTEEATEIIPAINRARESGFRIEGPVPADTLFSKASGGKYDGCVAMYHDQGHIPFKYGGFVWDEKAGRMSSVSGVNITLGLPIIRTSVDHGTAFDIAGKGIASPDALVSAIEYAVKLASS